MNFIRDEKCFLEKFKLSERLTYMKSKFPDSVGFYQSTFLVTAAWLRRKPALKRRPERKQLILIL